MPNTLTKKSEKKPTPFAGDPVKKKLDKLALSLNAKTQKYIRHGQAALILAIEMGEEFRTAKEEFRYGNAIGETWSSWVAKNCILKLRQVQNLMLLAKERDEIEAEIHAYQERLEGKTNELVQDENAVECVFDGGVDSTLRWLAGRKKQVKSKDVPPERAKILDRLAERRGEWTELEELNSINNKYSPDLIAMDIASGKVIERVEVSVDGKRWFKLADTETPFAAVQRAPKPAAPAPRPITEIEPPRKPFGIEPEPPIVGEVTQAEPMATIAKECNTVAEDLQAFARRNQIDRQEAERIRDELYALWRKMADLYPQAA